MVVIKIFASFNTQLSTNLPVHGKCCSFKNKTKVH